MKRAADGFVARELGDPAPPVPLSSLFLAFLRLGLTAFGGPAFSSGDTHSRGQRNTELARRKR